MTLVFSGRMGAYGRTSSEIGEEVECVCESVARRKIKDIAHGLYVLQLV